MSLDLGRILSRTYSICWRHKWLWILGALGGTGGFTFNGRFIPGGPGGSADQVTALIRDNLWLIVLVVALVLLVALVVFLFGCVAVPACVWAGLTLDAGRPAALGAAWRQGSRRFWVYLRLSLLRFLIGMGVVAAVVVLGAIGLAVYGAAGNASLVVLIPLGVLLIFAFGILVLTLNVLLVWSDRTALILGVGAIDAIRSSVWLTRHNKLDTVIFAIVFGLVTGLTGLGVFLVAALVASPGVVLLAVGLLGGPGILLVAGLAWVVLLGLPAAVVGSGLVGSLVQVGYALACRDLCLRWGLEVVAAEPARREWNPPSGLSPVTAGA